MSRFAGTVIVLAVLLAGCSRNQSISPEELKSDSAELASIAAESELFADFVASGHSTDAYAKGHSKSLREQLSDLRKDLQKKHADPDLQDTLTSLQKLSDQLDEALTALPSNSRDPRWQNLVGSFAHIAQAAQSPRRAP
ncbi:MAG TPA: hypothetical protein VFU86_22635 [Terriglobales bacterium]|nr:hypothetical protein [Terriglobales bacterium]